jgi:predicted GIY-YIG superfamily endonuclease
MGTVYLIHFERPFKHARHYIGYSDNLDARTVRHNKGNGAKLLHHVKAAGIHFEVVKTWEDKDRAFERKLKNLRQSWRRCPVCRERKGLKPDLDARAIEKGVRHGSTNISLHGGERLDGCS